MHPAAPPFPPLDGQTQAIAVIIRAGEIRLALLDGRRIAAPLSFYPTLENATPRQRRNWRFLGPGLGIEWPDLDLQLSAEGILAGRREHLPPRGFRKRQEARKRRQT